MACSGPVPAAVCGSSRPASVLAASASISDSKAGDSARMVTPASVTDQISPVDGDAQIVFTLTFDAYDRVVDQLGHQGNVARQDADLARGGAGEHESRLAGPDLAFDGDDVDIQFGHLTSPLSRPDINSSSAPRLSAFFPRSSRPPIRKNACSGRWSKSPLPQIVERLDGLLQRHRRTRLAGELLGGHHVLAQEALDAAGAVDQLFVLLGELVDAEDGDDVLKVPVALQDSDDLRHGTR